MRPQFFIQTSAPPRVPLVVASSPAEYTKDFWFNADAEGWSANPSSGIEMAWQKPRARQLSEPRTADPIAKLLGKLRTTAKQNASASSVSAWEYSGTWHDLGVPNSKTVTNVRANYLFRYNLFLHHSSETSLAAFAATDTGSGPFEVRSSGGAALVATLSAFEPCGRVRPDSGVFWGDWPAANYSDAVSLTPTSWRSVSAGNVSISAPYQAASTTIMLRLKVKTPSIANAVHSIVRIWHNAIRLTITAE